MATVAVVLEQICKRLDRRAAPEVASDNADSLPASLTILRIALGPGIGAEPCPAGPPHGDSAHPALPSDSAGPASRRSATHRHSRRRRGTLSCRLLPAAAPPGSAPDGPRGPAVRQKDPVGCRAHIRSLGPTRGR